MNNTQKIPLGILTVVVVLAIVIGYLVGGSSGAPKVGGTVENFPVLFSNGLKAGNGSTPQFQISSTGALTTTGTLTLGTNGTALNAIQTGTCTIYAYSTTIAATSSARVDCQAGAAALTAITGIASGDRIFATLASTTVDTTQGGLVLESAAASTTAGFITLKILNLTGAAFTWVSTASSSISYLALR